MINARMGRSRRNIPKERKAKAESLPG